MKLKTIKRNNKKKIIIGSMIVLSVVGCITLTTTRAKYKSVQSIKLASGTVNYKVSDLHIVAVKVSEDGINYSNSETVPTTGYTLNKEKSKCRIPDSSQTGENALVDENVTIDYQEGKLIIIGLNKKNTKCYMYFDKKLSTSSENTIAKLNVQNIKEGTPDFTQVAIGAEIEDNNGVYVTDDPMYQTTDNPNPKTYYWRGASTTNHVIFDNKCWRIVRINGDGSIRLIYNGTPSGTTCPGNGTWNDAVISGLSDSEKYYATSGGTCNYSSYAGWSYTLNEQRTTGGRDSNAKIQTEQWYNINISDGAKLKVDENGKFCNDRNVDTAPSLLGNGYTTTWSEYGTNFAYAVIKRLYEDYNPTLSCSSGDTYSLKVGAITADEVEFAGGTIEKNDKYYIYAASNYWTMSPSYWEGTQSRVVVFYVDYSGILNGAAVNKAYGLRPVINIRNDVTFNSGSDGTQNNPYIVQ